MRSDMFEVLIERPRAGWRIPRRKRGRTARRDAFVRRPSGGRLDVEDAEALGERLPVRESTSANRGGCKTLTDLLGPLERFLQSRLNRPWDDVLSEVHAVIKPGHALQRHLLEHLERLVDTRLEWVEGVLCAHRYQLLPLRSGAFYVDPRTGRLRRFEQRRR